VRTSTLDTSGRGRSQSAVAGSFVLLAAVDWLVAAVLIIVIAVGAHLH
jgi:hypothetical protein